MSHRALRRPDVMYPEFPHESSLGVRTRLMSHGKGFREEGRRPLASHGAGFQLGCCHLCGGISPSQRSWSKQLNCRLSKTLDPTP